MPDDIALRTCKFCSEEKPLADFYFDRYSQKHRADCRDCNKIKSKAWRVKNRDYFRSEHLRRKYGITLADYEAMEAAQDGRCAICDIRPIPQPHRDLGLFVDHDHGDGGVRGLLCSSCNTGLGAFGDDPDRLLAAATYLLARTNVLAPDLLPVSLA